MTTIDDSDIFEINQPTVSPIDQPIVSPIDQSLLKRQQQFQGHVIKECRIAWTECPTRINNIICYYLGFQIGYNKQTNKLTEAPEPYFRIFMPDLGPDAHYHGILNDLYETLVKCNLMHLKKVSAKFPRPLQYSDLEVNLKNLSTGTAQDHWVNLEDVLNATNLHGPKKGFPSAATPASMPPVTTQNTQKRKPEEALSQQEKKQKTDQLLKEVWDELNTKKTPDGKLYIDGMQKFLTMSEDRVKEIIRDYVGNKYNNYINPDKKADRLLMPALFQEMKQYFKTKKTDLFPIEKQQFLNSKIISCQTAEKIRVAFEKEWDIRKTCGAKQWYIHSFEKQQHTELEEVNEEDDEEESEESEEDGKDDE